jgi:hypothetical protein
LRPLQGPHCGGSPEAGAPGYAFRKKEDGANACTCADKSIWSSSSQIPPPFDRIVVSCEGADHSEEDKLVSPALKIESTSEGLA